MFYVFSDEELRSICRTNLEALEKWARLLLHYVLEEKLGPDYIHARNPDGNYKFKTKLVEKSDIMRAQEPGRFPTPLDTLFLEDIVYLLCHNDIFPWLSPYLSLAYPEGKEELRTFLTRLIPVRNKLSHTNPFSSQDAYRSVCYSNDFIDCVKYYFEQKNMAKEFNVPSIIKVRDSLGNEKVINHDNETVIYQLKDPETKLPKTLYRGDKFSITIEIDPSFPTTDYDIKWYAKDGMEILNEGRTVNFTIGNRLIGEDVGVSAELISHEDWHRWGRYDQFFILKFKALPTPPENP